MVDLSNITYHIIAVDEQGRQYNIKDFIENLGWEENENEISTRISFTVQNDKTSKGKLSSLIKPGYLVVVLASYGDSHKKEVARGYVVSWNPSQRNRGNSLKCICYDELYNLQKSQDNFYFPSGTGTQSAIDSILKAWQIQSGSYKGPNVAHGKLKFNNKYLSDMLLELLDDAVKKGGQKCIIRASKGKISILPRGENEHVYVFKTDNTEEINETRSTADMVTRVKVVGQADDDGNSSVEATLNGLTKYGVRQRIYTRGSDESLEDAQSAAQEILNENGKLSTDISVQSPDVPFIRKGDLIYLMAGSKGYYYIKSIQHNADTSSMTMDLEKAEQENVKNGSTEQKKEYNVGDIVNFHGGTHFFSSYPGARGYSASAGKAKITQKDGSGKAHPWHLIHEDSSSSNVYGWVDDGTFD